jgi:hypothetical protein
MEPPNGLALGFVAGFVATAPAVFARATSSVRNAGYGAGGEPIRRACSTIQAR